MKYLVCLDFDGTLCPIAPKPALAKLSNECRNKLASIAKAPHIGLAIISGRRLCDLKKKVALRGIHYAGNHGFEIEGPGIKYLHPKAAAARPAIKKIFVQLKNELKGIKGVLIEDKDISLSLHYRLVKPGEIKKVKRIFTRAIQPYLNAVKVTAGKKVLELQPAVNWDKGKTVRWLMHKLCKGKKTIPVYIGDDLTDEDAFAALKDNGITLRVGRSKNTRAQRCLKNINAVYKFLESL